MAKTYVTKETITNLLAIELSFIGEPFSIEVLDSAAEYIIDTMDVSSVRAIAESIRNYIFDTKMNYPNFFKTGEC